MKPQALSMLWICTRTAAILVVVLSGVSFFCNWKSEIPPNAMVWTLDGSIAPGTKEPFSDKWTAMSFAQAQELGMQPLDGLNWRVDTTLGDLVFSRLGLMEPHRIWRHSGDWVQTIDTAYRRPDQP